MVVLIALVLLRCTLILVAYNVLRCLANLHSACLLFTACGFTITGCLGLMLLIYRYELMF